jgi:hypothetical protein
MPGFPPGRGGIWTVVTSWLFANATEGANGQSQPVSSAPSHRKTLGHPKAGEQPSVWALHEHFYRLAGDPSSPKRRRVAL